MPGPTPPRNFQKGLCPRFPPTPRRRLRAWDGADLARAGAKAGGRTLRATNASIVSNSSYLRTHTSPQHYRSFYTLRVRPYVECEKPERRARQINAQNRRKRTASVQERETRTTRRTRRKSRNHPFSQREHPRASTCSIPTQSSARSFFVEARTTINHDVRTTNDEAINANLTVPAQHSSHASRTQS